MKKSLYVLTSVVFISYSFLSIAQEEVQEVVQEEVQEGSLDATKEAKKIECLEGTIYSLEEFEEYVQILEQVYHQSIYDLYKNLNAVDQAKFKESLEPIQKAFTKQAVNDIYNINEEGQYLGSDAADDIHACLKGEEEDEDDDDDDSLDLDW